MSPNTIPLINQADMLVLNLSETTWDVFDLPIDPIDTRIQLQWQMSIRVTQVAQIRGFLDLEERHE